MTKLTRPSTLAAAIVFAGLAGCAQLPMAGPDYRTPAVAVPANWSSTPASPGTAVKTAPNLARWWERLGDARLNGLIADALAQNLDVKQAQARLRQARASRHQAVSTLFPSISASAGASRSKTSVNAGSIAALPGSSYANIYDAGFDASWEADLFGANRRGVEAASADLAATQASLENVRVSLVAEVAQNYIEALSYRRRIVIARDNLASQSETLQITQWRYEAGLTSSSDVDQARTNLEQTRASIPDLETGQAAAQNRIAVLLGRSPGSLNDRLAGAPSLPAVPDSVATGIPADVLTRRPDLVSAERTLAAETARTGQKMAQRFPSLNLSGSFGWQAYSLAALGGAGTLYTSLAGSLAATLFDGGRLRSAVDAQDAVREQALNAYEGSVLLALEDVENALTDYAASHERLSARVDAADAARSAATQARQMYESGLSDFQKLLETERTRLTAEDNLATAQTTQLNALIKLYKALGGGWDSRVDAAQQTTKAATQDRTS